MNATEKQTKSLRKRGERTKNMSKASTKSAKTLLIEELCQLGQTQGVNAVTLTEQEFEDMVAE